MATLLETLHPGMMIAHVDEEAQTFITWNGSSTFRVFILVVAEVEEVDVFTRYEVEGNDHAERIAAAWWAERKAADAGE